MKFNFCRFYNRRRKSIFNYWESTCDNHDPYIPVSEVNIILGSIELSIITPLHLIGKSIIQLFILLYALYEKTNSKCDK